MAKASTIRNGDGGLGQVLREARLAEAAHFDAALDLRDAKSLRLQLLKDDLAPAAAASDEARALFDLALVPGEPPKLWIDLVSYVTMEPDPRTYRFVQDRQDSREVILETANRGEMAETVRRHMAHRIIQRARQSADGAATEPQSISGYSSGSLVLAWTSGFAFGAMLLLAVVLILGLVRS